MNINLQILIQSESHTFIVRYMDHFQVKGNQTRCSQGESVASLNNPLQLK
jgi:hypothetical protein